MVHLTGLNVISKTLVATVHRSHQHPDEKSGPCLRHEFIKLKYDTLINRKKRNGTSLIYKMYCTKPFAHDNDSLSPAT